MREEIPQDATHRRHKHEIYKVTNKVQHFNAITGEWDDVIQDPYDLEEWLLELKPLAEQPR